MNKTKSWSLMLGGIAVAALVVLIAIFFYSNQDERIYKKINEKQDQMVFQIDNHTFSYKDWDDLNKYYEALILQGNQYYSDNPSLSLIDAFYLTLYEVDATARGLNYSVKDSDFTMLDLQEAMKADPRTKEQIAYTINYMSVDENYFFQTFLLKYLNKEAAKSVLFNKLVGDPAYNWNKMDFATTQIPEAKDYHKYLIAEYGDKVVTKEKIIKRLLK